MSVSDANAMLPVNIAVAIKAKRMTNNEVAKRSGHSVQQLSDMLHGRKIIKPCDILAISDALGIDVDELFRDRSTSA